MTISCKIISGSEVPFEGVPKEKLFFHISVADNGIGFEEKYTAKIFELFQRLHSKDTYSGTGIGLALCKKIVDNMNGYISAKSEPQKGSVFSVYMPKENN
jgi:signal transduction histidine kinase